MSTAQNLSPPIAASLALWHDMAARGSMDRLADISADDCVFRSPAFYKPYRGKEALQIVLSSVLTVFEDFTYHRTLTSDDGLNVMLEFSAHIGGTQLKGIDLVRFTPDGKIAEFEVMVRPMNALMALGRLMSERAGPKLMALGNPDTN